ncbi:hypothetical protein LZX06_06700 [Campylobacter coli]|uniref:Uncharacterized protein n=2 Tax=Campylobacter coli TaxID=195 RepID=A0A381CGS9_CAMCO|nr:hypothetical protein [Campylobacter coli]EAK3887912.1 hypothetical protein [Campylobacter hyointestinalis]EAL3816756.1 hypothetical protein [Campylobacter fetus]HED4583054.1 hypothetical protein [Campylobacter jejuni]AHK73211.1 hypothetical protein YSQ_04355 [Campylobacter coli RM1875]EAH4457911.1 hypothetical protein [Campylobacter coli]
MPIPNLAINIIRFLVSTYKLKNETYAYSEFGKYIRVTFSKLNEKSDVKEILDLIRNFDEKKLVEFYDLLVCATKNFKDFLAEFKAKLFCFICEEMRIEIKSLINK